MFENYNKNKKLLSDSGWTRNKDGSYSKSSHAMITKKELFFISNENLAKALRGHV